MSIDILETIIPGRGTVFIAPKNTPLPDGGLDDFSLTADTVGGTWKNIGHTSKNDMVSFSKEGGETETKETWLSDSARVIYSAAKWSMTVSTLQVNEQNLNLAFNGGFTTNKKGYVVPATPKAVEMAIFIYAEDNTGKLGFHIPSASFGIDDAPSFAADEFFGLKLKAALLAAPMTAFGGTGSEPGIMAVYKTGLQGK